MGRISGPLMDRFDLRLEVPPVSYRDLEMPAGGETSAVIARRVADARACQAARFAELGVEARVNADAEGALAGPRSRHPMRRGQAMLLTAAERFRLTARGYHRILRLARTIADLDHVETVSTPAYRRGARLPPHRRAGALGACEPKASIASQIRPATFTPSKRSSSWMPVGEVTLISVR
jgi:predicted ATPase with chaperone activity